MRRVSCFSRSAVFSIGFSSKCDGITGSLANVHLPRLTSSSSGSPISTRWPTAELITYRSFSKWSPSFLMLPSAFAISLATDGFFGNDECLSHFFSVTRNAFPTDLRSISDLVGSSYPVSSKRAAHTEGNPARLNVFTHCQTEQNGEFVTTGPEAAFDVNAGSD